jgi:hypothetical protein
MRDRQNTYKVNSIMSRGRYDGKPQRPSGRGESGPPDVPPFLPNCQSGGTHTNEFEYAHEMLRKQLDYETLKNLSTPACAAETYKALIRAYGRNSDIIPYLDIYYCQFNS